MSTITKSTTVIITFGDFSKQRLQVGKYERDSSSPPHGWSSASRSRCLSTRIFTRMLNPLRASRQGYNRSAKLATRSNNECTETTKRSVDKITLESFNNFHCFLSSSRKLVGRRK
ncbi:hypothetical protein C4D60_Mb05t00530 [Musa balbisiana]|uniref:Uncharacterized protein n=1 Tax=Musa balbisiana TaxID=52838 RepID=A0A4S8JSP5_MUSBA|nr:hypothetical protein C4D60_Mb05t00530 [Musa balbisiana]